MSGQSQRAPHIPQGVVQHGGFDNPRNQHYGQDNMRFISHHGGPAQYGSGHDKGQDLYHQGGYGNKHSGGEPPQSQHSAIYHFQNSKEELSYIKYLMSEKYKVFEKPEIMQLRTKSI